MEPQVVIYGVLGLVIVILTVLFVRERRLVNKAIKIVKAKNDYIRLIEHQASMQHRQLGNEFENRMKSFGFTSSEDSLSKDADVMEKFKAIVQEERPLFQARNLARKKAAEKAEREERAAAQKRYEEQRAKVAQQQAEREAERQSSSSVDTSAAFVAMPIITDTSFSTFSCDAGSVDCG